MSSSDKEKPVPEPFFSDNKRFDNAGTRLWRLWENGKIDEETYEKRFNALQSQEAAHQANRPPDWAEDADEGPNSWPNQIPDSRFER